METDLRPYGRLTIGGDLVQSKVCPKCSLEKPFSEFHKHIGKKYNLAVWCKTCAIKNTRNHYSKADKSELLKKKRQWQAKNKDHVYWYNNKWFRENPWSRSAKEARRRASLLQATPKWVNEQHHKDIMSVYRLAKKLEFLFNTKYHVDHIVPLQGENVCGLHVPWNLQILEAKLNCKKSNRFEENWNVDI
jgi:hypothetical protein